MSDTATPTTTSGAAQNEFGSHPDPQSGSHAERAGSAGMTGTAVARRPLGGRRRRRLQDKWQNKLWDSTPTSVLVDQATRLVEQQDRRRAVRLLAVATATTEDRAERQAVLEQLAVTAADGGQHRVSCDAVFELQQLSPRDADLWVTFANVALSRGNYVHADSAARSALELDGDHQGAWAALTASYAGLGWFEAAETCLDRLDRNSLTELQRWRIGRAVNRWSLANTRWVVMAAVSAILLGVLAVAIAVSTPFVTREWRLRHMRRSATGRTFEALAATAWRSERRLRLWHLGLVTLSVVTFAAATFLG